MVSGRLTEPGATLTYKLTVGEAMTIALDGPPDADFDVYVRRGAPPRSESYDQRGYTVSSKEKVRITPLHG